MPSDLPPRCAACAARDMALCDGLGGAELAALHDIGRRRRLSAGQAFGWSGDPASHCANLVSGVLKVSRVEADGGVQIVGLLYPGDFVGALFAERCTDTIAALSDADLCVYPRVALEALLIRHPAAGRLLLRRTMATLAEVRPGCQCWPVQEPRRGSPHCCSTWRVGVRWKRTKHSACRCHGLRWRRRWALAVETVSRHMTAFQQGGLIALSGLRGVRLLDRVRLVGIAG